MTYTKTDWKDHIIEFPNRYTQTAGANGTIVLTKSEGNIVQAGTPVSASNLNNQEFGIFENRENEATLFQEVMQVKRDVDDNKAEIGTTTLTNSLEYPFNNSLKTVAIVEKRNTIRDYEVSIDVVSSDGPVGEIKVSAKLTNGFKVEYTGSAKNVTLKYYLRGGTR
jgi:hypothetical protein